MKKRLVIILAILFLSFSSLYLIDLTYTGKVIDNCFAVHSGNLNDFYVDNSGKCGVCNDENSGTINNPWCTIQKAANTLLPGQTVYVREGTYDEEISITKTGLKDLPITFSVYPGDEGRVLITGAKTLSLKKCSSSSECLNNPDWDKLYYSDEILDIQQVFDSNFKILPPSRFPESGFLYSDNPISSISSKINDSALDFQDDYLVGAIAHIKFSAWAMNNLEVNFSKTGLIQFYQSTSYNLTNLSGYYLTNTKNIKQGQWMYTPQEKRVYLWPENSNYFSGSVKNIAISISNSNFIKIIGFNISYFNYAGIFLNKSYNFEIVNNTISYIDGKGIFAYEGSLATSFGTNKISGNSIINLADSGMYLQTIPNLEISENIIQGIGTSIYGGSLYAKSKIRDANRFRADAIIFFNCDNASVSNNYIQDIAKSGIAWTDWLNPPSGNRYIRDNIIINTMLAFYDYGAIYSDSPNANQSFFNRNDYIENNIIQNSYGYREGSYYREIDLGGAIGIYLDNGRSKVIVRNNTLINMGFAGILSNFGADTEIINNTLYNSPYEIYLKGTKTNTLKNFKISGNRIYTGEGKKTVYLIASGYVLDNAVFGTSDNNLFQNPSFAFYGNSSKK